MAKDKNLKQNKNTTDEKVVEEIGATEEVVEVQEEVIETPAPEVKEKTKQEKPFRSSLTAEEKIKQVVFSDLSFEERMEAYSRISDEYKSVIDTVLAYDKIYKDLKVNNMYLNEKDIKSTMNLYLAFKFLLSATEFAEIKGNIMLLLDIVKNYRLTSLNPMNYASGLDKWTGKAEDAEEFLAIMHTLNTIIVDGPRKTLTSINFGKFTFGEKFKTYLESF